MKLQSSPAAACVLLLVVIAPGAYAIRPNGLRTLQQVTVAIAAAPCSNAQSPVAPLSSGNRWTAQMSGQKNIAPNTTGVAMPAPGPARGTFDLIVDETGQRASWKLTLCDFPQYIASHLHSGSANADYPPPLIPLEPYGKPTDPLAPPALLPQLCPPINVVGCSYTKEGTFLASDIIPLVGRQPLGDPEVPTITSWDQFLSALKDGKIYVNVHSLQMPAGLIRGNLESAGSVGGGSSSTTGSGNNSSNDADSGASEDSNDSGDSSASAASGRRLFQGTVTDSSTGTTTTSPTTDANSSPDTDTTSTTGSSGDTAGTTTATTTGTTDTTDTGTAGTSGSTVECTEDSGDGTSATASVGCSGANNADAGAGVTQSNVGSDDATANAVGTSTDGTATGTASGSTSTSSGDSSGTSSGSGDGSGTGASG
eukprot:GHRR01000180.1.p1 GENE.GHRR01000180.1~~GHRR01000180.1.p1  ORF type:complete len:425 (+),score=148.19 GHRR01000180.1:224-1498(+)